MRVAEVRLRPLTEGQLSELRTYREASAVAVREYLDYSRPWTVNVAVMM